VQEKKQMADMGKWFIVLALVGVIILGDVGGIGSKLKDLELFSTTDDSELTTEDVIASDTLCTVEDVTVTLTSQEKYNIDATVNGADRLLVRTNGVWIDKGYYTDGSSVTLSVGDEYQAIMRENSSTHYPELETGTIGYPEGASNCRGTHQIYAQVLDYDTTFPNAYIIDEDGSLNGDGNYNINAGDVATSTVTMKATSEDGFGSPGSGFNVLVCEYNTTEFSALSISDAGSDVATSSAVSAPQRHTNNLTGSPGKVVYGFEPIEDVQKVVLDITVQADSTNGGNPSQDVFCSAYDTVWFRDTVTNDVTGGVEDTQASTTNKGQTEVMNFTIAYN